MSKCAKCGGEIFGRYCKLCEMFTARQAPSSVSDRELLIGWGTLEKQFGRDPKYLNHITQTAIKHGYRPSPSDMYHPGCADFAGDPKAFVKGRGDIMKVIKKRNVTVDEPLYKHRATEPVVDPWSQRKPLAEKIVKRLMKEYIQRDPSLAHNDKRELRAQIIEKHGQKVS